MSANDRYRTQCWICVGYSTNSQATTTRLIKPTHRMRLSSESDELIISGGKMKVRFWLISLPLLIISAGLTGFGVYFMTAIQPLCGRAFPRNTEHLEFWDQRFETNQLQICNDRHDALTILWWIFFGLSVLFTALAIFIARSGKKQKQMDQQSLLWPASTQYTGIPLPQQAAPVPSLAEELERLAALKESGVITDEDLQNAKFKLMRR